MDHLTPPQTLDSKTSEMLADLTLQVPDGVDGQHVLLPSLVGVEAGLHLLLHQGRPSIINVETLQRIHEGKGHIIIEYILI